MRSLHLNRPARWAAVVVGTVAAVLVGTAGVANAATGTVNTSGGALTVRAGPSTNWDAFDTRADGASVTILCQTRGGLLA